MLWRSLRASNGVLSRCFTLAPRVSSSSGAVALRTYARIPPRERRRHHPRARVSAEPQPVPEPASTSLIPVSVPEDPEGVLDHLNTSQGDKLRNLFAVPAIVVVRQIEMMNVFLGYEEANKYQLLSPSGELLGYLLEEEAGMGAAVARQMLRTHRSFRATVMDADGEVLLRIRRPFSWINSKIFVSVPGETEGSEKIIGEAQQEWHVYRRRYNFFVSRDDGVMYQFGRADGGLLAWDFYIQDSEQAVIGSITRNFAGLARELFTDTGHYVLRFEGVADEIGNPAIPSPNAPALSGPNASETADPARTGWGAATIPSSPSTELQATESHLPATVAVPSITYDQRAVMLAAAVSIDFDYFSRSRGGIAGGGFIPIPIGMGGAATGAEAEAGAAGVGAEAEAGSMESEMLPPTDIENFDKPVSGDLRGDAPEGVSSGWGWGWGNDTTPEQSPWGTEAPPEQGGWGTDEHVMEDPWAPEPSNDDNSFSWGDFFPTDDE